MALARYSHFASVYERTDSHTVSQQVQNQPQVCVSGVSGHEKGVSSLSTEWYVH